MANGSLTLVIAYAEWGSANRRSLVEAIRCAESARADIRQIIVVDNKLDRTPYTGSYSGRTIVIAGDNRAREFSAWDLAVQNIDKEVKWTCILFANDTFVAHRRIWLPRRWRIARWLNFAGRSAEPILFGQIDPFLETSVFLPFGELKDYISSYAFGVNRAAASALFPLGAAEPIVEEMLEIEFTDGGLFTQQVDRRYAMRLEQWLLKPGNWRNAAPLNRENFAFMRLKAKSIIYEHTLSCRAAHNGTRISDFYKPVGSFDRILTSILVIINKLATRVRDFMKRYRRS